MRYFVIFPPVLLAACGSSVPLPDHRVSSDPLAAGSARVQIDAGAGLTKEECEALIENYRSRAGSDGQVSVHKPSASLAGQSAPWCVDNLEGAGIRFNEILF